MRIKKFFYLRETKTLKPYDSVNRDETKMPCFSQLAKSCESNLYLNYNFMKKLIWEIEEEEDIFRIIFIYRKIIKRY